MIFQTPEPRSIIFIVTLAEFNIGGGGSNDMSGLYGVLTLTPLI